MKPKFKIGDKVRIKNKTKIFTITEIPINPFSGEIRYFLNNSTNTLAELELELEESRKIIGYKVPFDIFNGSWKKGEIVRFEDGFYWDNYSIRGKSGTVPKEIAETWEPVYEEVKVEKPKTIFERVNSFQDAHDELGLKFKDRRYASYNSFDRLKIICKALNEGWVADWNDDKQEKWSLGYNTITKELFVDCSLSLLITQKSLYLKSKALAKHLSKIAVKELLEFFYN